MHVNCNSIEKHCPVFFPADLCFIFEEIAYANNCFLFCESGLQITLHLLSSSLGNTVLLHMLFLEYETQIGEIKILDNVFQLNCNSHVCITSDKSEKNRKTA